MSSATSLRELRKSDLILRLRSLQSCDADEDLPVIRAHPVQGVSPLERRWGLEARLPGTPWEQMPFNTMFGWRHNREVDVECLARAAEEIVRRHPILGYTLQFRDGGWRFVLRPTHGLQIFKIDASGFDSATAAEHAGSCMGEFRYRPFDLDGEGPMRIAVAKISKADYFICCVVHHAFADGYSMRILSYELAALYESLRDRRSSPLGPAPLSFLDYMVSIEEWRKRPQAEKLISYWERYLAGTQPPGYEREDTLVQGSFAFSPCMSKRVRELTFSKRIGSNLFWEAAHQITLCKLLGTDDITTLTVDVGRRQKELTGSFGQYINLLPIRSTISRHSHLSDLLAHLNRSRRESATYGAVPYDLIADRCAYPYAASIGNMNFIPQEFQPLDSLGPPPTTVRLPENAARRVIYPYVLGITDAGTGEFTVRWLGYVRKPFTTAELASMFERVAIRLVEEPDCNISALRV